MHSRDPRRDAADVMGDPDPYRPEPGDGAREAKRAADLDRQALDGASPSAGPLDRIARWVRSLLGRR
jgi:hypothetical protein